MFIHVINPNSDKRITDIIASQVPTFIHDRYKLRFVTIEDAPLGIETDDEVAAANQSVFSYAMEQDNDDWILSACFSDPGVKLLKDAGRPRVVGIAEAAMRTAQCISHKFGTISLSDSSTARHNKYNKSLGTMSTSVGEVSVNHTVFDASDPNISGNQVISAAKQLRSLGAGSVILG
ncbi:MAG: aspartate/glutamate racemase family protein, partial [Pseudomonadota bacterium]